MLAIALSRLPVLGQFGVRNGKPQRVGVVISESRLGITKGRFPQVAESRTEQQVLHASAAVDMSVAMLVEDVIDDDRAGVGCVEAGDVGIEGGSRNPQVAAGL